MKYFGSETSIINAVVSKIIFRAFTFRMKYLKIKNRIKNNSKNVQMHNSLETKTMFNSWFDKGFDKINIGGGRYNLEGFINLDFVKFDEVERCVVANILDLSFIPDKTITHIYSNQVLEHLNETQILTQLGEYKRILKADGIISFRTPNILGVCYGFWFGQQPETNYDAFLQLGYPKDAFFYDKRDGWYHKDLFALFHWIYADVGNIKNEHLSIFTPSKIKKYLFDSGYSISLMTEPECSQIIVMAKPNINE